MEINSQFTNITAKRREEIYDEVWAEPLITVAEKYHISDTALRNHCKKLGIPLPQRGYWAKVQNGQKVGKTILPSVSKEVSKYVREYFIKFRDNEPERTDEDIRSGEDFNMLTQDTIAYIKKKCGEIKVSGQLRDPSKEIEDHRAEMEYRKKRDKELKSFQGTRYYYTVSAKYRENKEVLPIDVSSENINRAYRIADAIIKSLYEFESSIRIGQEILCSPYKPIDTAVIKILGTKFYISVNEKIKANNKLLVFKARVDNNVVFEISDLPDKPLQEQLGNIFYQLLLLGNRYHANYVVQRREEYRRWEEELKTLKEEERQRTLQKIRDNRLEEMETLLKSVSDWEKAEKLRTFLDALEKKMPTINDAKQKQKLMEWINDNRNKANWLDPLVQVYDEQLGESPYIINKIIDGNEIM